MSKMKSIRVLGLVLAAMMFVSVFAACGDAVQTPAAGTEQTPATGTEQTPAASGTTVSDPTALKPATITMWGWNPGDIQKIFDEYSKTYAGDTLNYVTVQQTEAFQKLQTTVSAGLELPDIVPSEIGQRGTMIKLDIWEDLSKAPYNFDSSMVFDYLLPLLKNDRGELVCTPWDITTAALAYKRPIAKQYLGSDDPAEVQKAITSWEDVLNKGKEINQKSGGKVFMFASLNDVRILMDGQNPAPIVQDGTLSLDSVKTTLATMANFRDNNIVDNISSTSPAYNASYPDETHLLYPCASWSPQYVIAPNDPNGAGKWGLIVPPGGAFSWGGSGHMIPKDAKNKENAFRFINWLVTKDGAISQRQTVGYNMANKAMYEDPQYITLSDKNFGDQNLGQIFFVDALKNIHPRPVSAYDVIIADTWSLVTEALNNDRSMTADAAVKMFETEFRNKAPEVK